MNNSIISIAPMLTQHQPHPNRWSDSGTGWLQNQNGQRVAPLPSQFRFENGGTDVNQQPLVKVFVRWFARLMGISA